eukprot:c25160_g1_i1 orf=131-2668(-)
MAQRVTGCRARHANRCQSAMSKHTDIRGLDPINGSSIHPLLRGGQPVLPHGFSKAQMEAFAAVCDTLFPSLSSDEYLASLKLVSDIQRYKALSKHEQQLLEDYLQLSASDINLPTEAAGYMTKLLKLSQARRIHLALWLLTTRLGTLILGGKHAIIATSFPFIFNFASLPQHKRHELLRSLSQSWVYFKQELFQFFKGFVCWSMFTKVDAFGVNPMFEAINYRVGEEEDVAREEDDAMKKEVEFKEEKLDAMKEDQATSKEIEDPMKGESKDDTTADTREKVHLLSQRVIDANAVGVRLGDELARLGITQLADVSHLEALRRCRRAKRGEGDVVVGVKCDVVIAGSGPGGAVVAAKLARQGYRVVVLEKGGYFPVGTYSQLEGPSLYEMYEEGGCLVTDDSRMVLLAGATVGGGSTINWSASFRTPCHVRNEWAHDLQLDLFSSPAYDHAMDAVCSRLGVQSDVAHENFSNSVLRAGCTSLGFHVDNIPRNCPPNHQCGFCGLGCQQGKKQGAMQTWLEDAAQADAVLISSCKAEEVLSWPNQKRRRVAGLVARVAGTGVTVFVEADVVVSACGALRTPPLLRQSGLRNAAIGKNLHIHPVQLVWGHFEEGRGPAGACYRGGIMTAYSNVASNWDTSGYGALIQCPGAQPGFVAIGMPWVSAIDFKTHMQKFSRTAFFIVLTRDKAGGHVSTDGDGRLCVRYQLSDVDKENLRVGAEKGLRILRAAGACQVGTYNSDGESYVVNKDAMSDATFEEFLGRVRETSFQKLSTLTVSAHQMGSCRMGAHSSSSAVRPSGETWEIEGLFVADSSVFPTATGVNPMITVQSIAFCIADSILAYLKQKNRP